LFSVVRELTGAKSNSNVPVKDKSGKTLLTAEEHNARWVEHFKEVLNQPEPLITYDFNTFPVPEELPSSLQNITEEETQRAIKSLKNNKAAGCDEISAELLKFGGHSLLSALTSLMNRCWRAESVPDEWRQGIIVKVEKKGDIGDCNNWRGITLLSVPGKVFCTILLITAKDRLK